MPFMGIAFEKPLPSGRVKPKRAPDSIRAGALSLDGPVGTFTLGARAAYCFLKSILRVEISRETTMKKSFGAALALFVAFIPFGGIMGQTQTLEQKIWTLLDDSKSPYVSLAE